jgi:hypothetical protein
MLGYLLSVCRAEAAKALEDEAHRIHAWYAMQSSDDGYLCNAAGCTFEGTYSRLNPGFAGCIAATCRAMYCGKHAPAYLKTVQLNFVYEREYCIYCIATLFGPETKICNFNCTCDLHKNKPKTF